MGTLLTTFIALIIAVPVGIGSAIFLAEGDRTWLWRAFTFTIHDSDTGQRRRIAERAIEGTIVLSAGAILLAVPFGVAAGIYVSEFRFSRWATTIRFLADVLVGVLSIIMGYFGYVMMVVWLGWGFSAAAGAIILTMISLPYICHTTELALQYVPDDLREAAYALSSGDRRVIMQICLPAALPGVLTGILLALAFSVGETATLLYTAGWPNYLWNGQLTHSPIGYLTYAVFTFINEPFAAANVLAYAAALLVTGFVLLINVLARFVLRRQRV